MDNNFNGSLMRNRRNLLDLGFTPKHFPRSNYSTDTQIKSEMKHTFDEDLFCNFHLLSDPLKKNLADSVITSVEKKKDMLETKEYNKKEAVKPPNTQRTDYYPSLAGITNFFSGVLNIMGTIFHKRASSPASQYYDSFDNDYNDQQLAPSIIWQSPNFEVLNKNEQADMLYESNNDHKSLDSEMSVDCRIAATHCEKKLNEVRLLLSNDNKHNVQNSKTSSKYSRRPRKAFIEASSVEESFEDAFSPENFLSLPSDTYIEYYSPFNYHDDLFVVSDAPRIKTDLNVFESMDITKNVLQETEKTPTETVQNLITDNCPKDEITVTKSNDEVVSSCEDKVSKLKALLQSKCRKSSTKDTNKEVETTEPIPIPHQDHPIETVFGTEINSSDIQNSNSSQNSDYFNEVTGRFNSSSVDSEDSFQIVFTDSPQNCRKRLSSDCESEDSFIVFEESPDSCYTSNEVFGEEVDLDNDSSDADSNYDEDSGCGATCKLSPSLSRTFCDLTDNSLYGQDVVDSVQVSAPGVTTTEKTGLLLDETRKNQKKKLPAKKVHFSTLPPKVHVMRVWAFAARQARAGHWERHALDRERFKRRIADVEMAISWVLKPQHRARVVFQRFRPWWNAQKRKELAEKKELEEREKMQTEDQKEAKENCELINSDDNGRKSNLNEDTGSNKKEIQNEDQVVENISEITKVNVEEDNILNNNTTHEKCKNIESPADKNICKIPINDWDQNDLDTHANDNDRSDIEYNNEINDSNETKNNDESLIKMGDLLIRDGCIDT